MVIFLGFGAQMIKALRFEHRDFIVTNTIKTHTEESS